MDPAHYRLAEAGLWWDSFEEEPEFEVMEYEFDDLTLHEGDRTQSRILVKFAMRA